MKWFVALSLMAFTFSSSAEPMEKSDFDRKAFRAMEKLYHQGAWIAVAYANYYGRLQCEPEGNAVGCYLTEKSSGNRMKLPDSAGQLVAALFPREVADRAELSISCSSEPAGRDNAVCELKPAF